MAQIELLKTAVRNNNPVMVQLYLTKYQFDTEELKTVFLEIFEHDKKWHSLFRLPNPTETSFKKFEKEFAKQVEIIQMFLEREVDINLDDGEPLIKTIQNRNVYLASFLLDHGASVDVRKGQALKIATDSDSTELVELLMKNIN